MKGTAFMTTDRRLLGAVFGLALFVAACSGSSSGTPAATSGAGGAASQGPAASAPPTAAPTDAAATADSGTGATGGGNPAAATDLEALIPDKVGSNTMQKTSIDYSTAGLAGIPVDQNTIGPYLSSKGKGIQDISLAMGVGQGSKPLVYVFRIKGVPASDFGPALFNQVTNGMDQKTIGGKQVAWTGAAGFTTAVYEKDDMLVYILMATEDEASQILSGMP
jgi:hypothetical protein